ncbi:MAG: YadA-like family protein [Phascolarctobacterium sp.]|nr:YadA-like family protein [Phascolarctobacterium sp.]
MNKIFKVVWSKVKHCYVVVSEIAKNTTSGGARRCRIGKVSLAAAMAAAVLTGSFAMPNSAWAADGESGSSSGIEESEVTETKVGNESAVEYNGVTYIEKNNSIYFATNGDIMTKANGQWIYSPVGQIASAGKVITVSGSSNIDVVTDDTTNADIRNYTVSLKNLVELKNVAGTTTITLNGNDGSMQSNSLTIGSVNINSDGINAGNKKITNVEAGDNDYDAVNVKQLKDYVADNDTYTTEVTASKSVDNNKDLISTTYTTNRTDQDGNAITYTGLSFKEGANIDLELDGNEITISSTATGTGSNYSWIAQVEGDSVKTVKPASEDDPTANVLNFVAGNANVTLANVNGAIEISATDTTLDSTGNGIQGYSALKIDDDGQLVVSVWDTSDKNVTASVDLKEYIKKVAGEGTSVNNTTINEQITNIISSVENLQKNDIHSMVVNANASDTGGTIELLRSNGENGTAGTAVASTLNFVSGGGAAVTSSDGNGATTTTYEDTWVKVYNADNTDGFKLFTGSTVRANVNDLKEDASPLTNLRVNGQDYKLFTGSDVAANNNLRVEQGYENKESNSGDTTLHGWVLVDDSPKDGNNPKTYSDTTLKAATFSPSVTNEKIGDEEVIYGGDYTISDTAGNKVTLEDVASANALKDVADRVTVVENSIENINQNIANAKTEVVAGNNVTVKETNSGDTNRNGKIDDNETKGHTIYTVSSKDTVTTINAGNNVTVEGGLDEESGNYAYTISATDTNTVNQHMKGTGWIAGDDGNPTDNLLIKVNDSDGKFVEATIEDVAKASNLRKESDERKEADATLAQAIINNQQNVQNLNAGLNKLGNRMNKVGAGSAALAALHPMDFDPDDKLQFSAGVGHYGGENAAALGAFYRPTEKVMFSVAGTMGNGEDMVNAGVTFALDKPNNVSNSRVAMAREIQDLRQQVAALTMLVMQMASRDNAALAGVAMFPDVPENHWAYDYIEGLQKQGIIDGYPDGNFGGDRTMTRYEYAAMLYRALEKGFPVDSRLLNEFNAELGRIRVDRIKGADNDANKVERVRVNNYEDRDDYGSKIVMVSAGK